MTKEERNLQLLRARMIRVFDKDAKVTEPRQNEPFIPGLVAAQVKNAIVYLLMRGVQLDEISRWLIKQDGWIEFSLQNPRNEGLSILEEAEQEAAIRMDFAKALKNAQKGSDLSYPLGFGFSKDDIRELAKLHKRNRYRRKIEDLLTDCNFHQECADFADGNYDEYLAEVQG